MSVLHASRIMDGGSAESVVESITKLVNELAELAVKQKFTPLWDTFEISSQANITEFRPYGSARIRETAYTILSVSVVGAPGAVDDGSPLDAIFGGNPLDQFPSVES